MPETDVEAVVCVAGPFPPTIGGMAVQAARLADHLAAERVQVIRLQSFPALPRLLRFVGRIRGVRTVVRLAQYVKSALQEVPNSTVVHHLVGSGPSFFLHTVPLLAICRYCKKRIILNYRSGNAGETFLRNWGWLAVPLMRRADCVVTPSSFLQRAFAQCGLPASTLPNIGDTELFPFQERQRFRPRLIVARQLEWAYDIGCILRAFALVQAKYADAALGIAGPGTQERQLRSLAEQLTLRNVTFYGQVPNPQMPAVYTQYDIAVNASVMDNFPGALLEAALVGLAIVSTDAGGITDMIRHGETGLLVPMRDHQRLAAAIVDVVERQDCAHERTLAARKWAEQYSWESVFPVLRHLYGLPEPRSCQCVRGTVAQPGSQRIVA